MRTILLPGRQPHINFHVCVLHLKRFSPIVSSLQNLLGLPSLQQLAFSLYHGGFVSWRLQEQKPLRQQQRQCRSLVRMRKGVSQQQEHVNGVSANQRNGEVKYGRPIWWGMQRGAHVCQSVRGATKWDTADWSDGACRRACMSVREETKWNTPDWLDGACRGTCMSVSGAMKWNRADQLDGACRVVHMSVRGATCREWRASSQCIIVE
jgi:hypothetical protein